MLLCPPRTRARNTQARHEAWAWAAHSQAKPSLSAGVPRRAAAPPPWYASFPGISPVDPHLSIYGVLFHFPGVFSIHRKVLEILFELIKLCEILCWQVSTKPCNGASGDGAPDAHDAHDAPAGGKRSGDEDGNESTAASGLPPAKKRKNKTGALKAKRTHVTFD